MSVSGKLSDHEVETIIGNLLRAGVLLSAAVVLLGGIAFLWKHGGGAPHYAAFQGEPIDLRSPGGVIRGALRFRGPDIIQLGILLLMATPIARVSFSLVAFAIQKDRAYVAITALVLGLLLYSLLGAAGP